MSKMSFYRGAALSSDRFAALSFEDAAESPGEPSAAFALHVFDNTTGTWTQMVSGENHGESVASWGIGADPTTVVALNRDGDLYFESPPGHSFRSSTNFQSQQADPLRWTGYNAVRQCGDRLYVLGWYGFIFSSAAPVDASTWEVLDPDYIVTEADEVLFERETGRARPETIDVEYTIDFAHFMTGIRSFHYAIDGPSHDNLLIGGKRPTLSHFDGKRVQPLIPGDKAAVTAIQYTALEDFVYVEDTRKHCALYRGTPLGGFELLHRAQKTDAHIVDLTEYKGEIFVATANAGLLRLWNGSLMPVTLPEQGIDRQLWAVEAKDGVLWALGSKALWRFENDAWRRFTYAED